MLAVSDGKLTSRTQHAISRPDRLIGNGPNFKTHLRHSQVAESDGLDSKHFSSAWEVVAFALEFTFINSLLEELFWRVEGSEISRVKMEILRTLFKFIDYQIAKFRFTIEFVRNFAEIFSGDSDK